ncbi:hypothetical protein [Calothrix sp. CCY 0018]|uniref:hypothetical protein n=1 Tax=Calothrix sp. CCY 0018 TaxID=3103864 RepID=UPI0039C7376C
MAPETEIIAQPSSREISPSIPPSSEVTTIQVGLAFIPVAFVVTLAFIFFKQIKHQKNLYTKLIDLKHFSSIPCRKCQFFDNNQQLPCAVQPAVVLSEEAVNCGDYAPKRR